MSVNEIQAAAEIATRSAIDQLLHRMAKAGEIDRRGRGKYGLPLEGVSEVSERKSNVKTPANTGLDGAYAVSDTSDTPSRAPALGPPGDSLDDFG